MKIKFALGFLTVAVTLISGLPAYSQNADKSAGDNLVLEEITVTARKTTERLQDAPLSITAFSAADIEKAGFANLEDVARGAPGVQYNNQGGQIPGRFNSAIRFRGMNVNSDSPSLQLGSLFVDGIYVLGGTQSIPYDDVERIEVIKGPQSATYGRSTFGGAINYITRTPSLTEYSGQLNSLIAGFSQSDTSASFEGPLMKDLVSFRIGGRYYNRGAVYRATDGGGLGEESSKSASLTLNIQPSDALNIKLRAFHDQDEDGPAMGGIVQGYLNDTCTGKTIKTSDPAVPTASPSRYVCGQVPELGTAISATGGKNIIDTPTNLFPTVFANKGYPNFVYDKLVGIPTDSRLDVPTIDHVGLIRTVTRFSAAATYDFADGYQLAAQAGKNEVKANWIRAFGLSPRGEWWSRDPQDSEDTSYEIRLSSPQKQKLTWLVGYNGYKQTFLQSGSGGDTIWSCPVSVSRAPGATCTGVPFYSPNSLSQNTDKVETTGIFASISYQLTDALALSLEGRQQKDDIKKAIFTSSPLAISDDSFVPRAIVRWTPSSETNVYASYAKGVLPGVINSELGKATDREKAQYLAQFPSVQGVIPGDELDMYELGWKQQWLDRRAQTNVAIYTGKWKYMKGRTLFVIQEDCGSFAHGGTAGATASTGCANGANGLPAILNGAPYVNSRNAVVPGDSKLSGIELEGSMLLTEHWDVRGNFTIAKVEYTDFIFNFVKPIAGFTQMKGNQTARYPKTSGSIASGYSAPLANTDWSWFVNGDLSYVGKTYADESNLAYCKAYTLGNIRFGGEKSGLRLEGFVKNVADNNSWAACARWTDFDSAPSLGLLTFYQGIAVTPNMPRQYGLRASYKF